jgi:hypothetical protein
MSSEYLTEEEHERLQKVLAALEKKNKPLPLWRLFREALLSGGACRDIVEEHVMCKLNRDGSQILLRREYGDEKVGEELVTQGGVEEEV